MINIEKNIPLPNIGDHIAMALSQMEVGDSFLLGDLEPNLRVMLYRKMTKAAPSKFLTRTVEGGTRVWRTE